MMCMRAYLMTALACLLGGMVGYTHTARKLYMLGNDETTKLTKTRNPNAADPQSNTTLPVQELYSNLSCPFEWSKYSCFRHENEKRAASSMEYALQQWIETAATRETPERLLLVGDSTMRQIFIAIGCRFWSANQTDTFHLDWMSKWPCHGTINCVESGQHSGFNVGSIRLRNGHEIHFLPHSGTLAKKEPGIVSRWMRELQSMGSSITFGSRLAMPTAGLDSLSQNDTIVFNMGLHWGSGRTKRLHEFSSFAKELDSTGHAAPSLVYITTVTQHFRTASGKYDNSKTKGCKSSVDVNPRREEELQLLSENVRHFIEYDDLALGDMHVGNTDCTHYCMPGPPDVVAGKLLRLWQNISSDRFNQKQHSIEALTSKRFNM